MKIRFDKKFHFIASLFLFLFLFSIFVNLKVDLYFSFVYASIITFTIGVAKEIYDYFDYGLFSVDDLVADAAGIAVGSIVVVVLMLLSLI